MRLRKAAVTLFSSHQWTVILHSLSWLSPSRSQQLTFDTLDFRFIAMPTPPAAARAWISEKRPLWKLWKRSKAAALSGQKMTMFFIVFLCLPYLQYSAILFQGLCSDSGACLCEASTRLSCRACCHLCFGFPISNCKDLSKLDARWYQVKKKIFLDNRSCLHLLIFLLIFLLMFFVKLSADSDGTVTGRVGARCESCAQAEVAKFFRRHAKRYVNHIWKHMKFLNIWMNIIWISWNPYDIIWWYSEIFWNPLWIGVRRTFRPLGMSIIFRSKRERFQGKVTVVFFHVLILVCPGVPFLSFFLMILMSQNSVFAEDYYPPGECSRRCSRSATPQRPERCGGCTTQTQLHLEHRHYDHYIYIYCNITIRMIMQYTHILYMCW